MLKTRIPGENTYPEAIIGLHENTSLPPLSRLITMFVHTLELFRT